MSNTIDVEARQSAYSPPQTTADIQRIRSDIERRLRPVCAGMAREEFQTLIDQMATVQIKYAEPEQR